MPFLTSHSFQLVGLFPTSTSTPALPNAHPHAYPLQYPLVKEKYNEFVVTERMSETEFFMEFYRAMVGDSTGPRPAASTCPRLCSCCACACRAPNCWRRSVCLAYRPCSHPCAATGRLRACRRVFSAGGGGTVQVARRSWLVRHRDANAPPAAAALKQASSAEEFFKVRG
jgi:hypothetical protein